MSFDAPAQQVPTPVMPAAPPPVMAPQGAKPKKKPQQATFLGSDATPGGGSAVSSAIGSSSGNMGGKTLLGT